MGTTRSIPLTDHTFEAVENYDGLLAAHAKLYAIVETLAENEPYCRDDEDQRRCVLCDAKSDELGVPELGQHHDDCPYRLAGEIIWPRWREEDPRQA